MAIFKLSDLRKSYTEKYYSGGQILAENRRVRVAEHLLDEQYNAYSRFTIYDVFLSHSLNDAIAILHLKYELESVGLSVYVDWISDPLEDRAKVDKRHADRIRRRIKNCKSFMYAFSENSKESKWMQWELGYADGIKTGRIAIVPIEVDGADPDFYRREYLGLYPYLELRRAMGLAVIGPSRISAVSTWIEDNRPYSYY